MTVKVAKGLKGIFGNHLTANGCQNVKLCNIVEIWSLKKFKNLKYGSFFHKIFVKSQFKTGMMKTLKMMR